MSKKTDQIKFMQAMFPNAKFVECNSTVSKMENVEVISKMETPTLTEQWKKGELEDGDYYVKTRQGIIIIDYFDVDEFSYDTNHYVEEVLAPVPSYEEWQELISKKNWCNARAKNLLDKNQKLKELLKECNYMILAYSINHDTFPKEKVKDIVTKIDEALK